MEGKSNALLDLIKPTSKNHKTSPKVQGLGIASHAQKNLSKEKVAPKKDSKTKVATKTKQKSRKTSPKVQGLGIASHVQEQLTKEKEESKKAIKPKLAHKAKKKHHKTSPKVQGLGIVDLQQKKQEQKAKMLENPTINTIFQSLDAQEAYALAQIINRFIINLYNCPDDNLQSYLQHTVQQEFPDLTPKQCEVFAHEVLVSLAQANQELPPNVQCTDLVNGEHHNSFLNDKINALLAATAKYNIIDAKNADELKMQLLKQGAEEATKAALAGALKVALNKGILKGVGERLSANSITNIASLSVDSVRIVHKVATKQMTKTEATKEFTDCAASTLAGTVGEAHGAMVGASVGGVIAGPIGVAVGAVVGGGVGSLLYSEGAKVGTQMVYTGLSQAPKVIDKAAQTLKLKKDKPKAD